MKNNNEINNTKTDDVISYKYKLKIRIEAFLSIPKSIIFNFCALPFLQAIKLPILINWHVKIKNIKKNVIKFDSPPRPFMVKIGFGGSEALNSNKSSILIHSGELIFSEHVTFSEGITLACYGSMKFGKNFFCNKNCVIWSSEKIHFGNDVLLGWDVFIRDSDGHFIIKDNKKQPYKKQILIGNHTWICSKVNILKGVTIQNNCIVAYGSVLNKEILGNNLLIAGTPGIIKSNNINWSRS